MHCARSNLTLQNQECTSSVESLRVPPCFQRWSIKSWRVTTLAENSPDTFDFEQIPWKNTNTCTLRALLTVHMMKRRWNNKASVYFCKIAPTSRANSRDAEHQTIEQSAARRNQIGSVQFNAKSQKYRRYVRIRTRRQFSYTHWVIGISEFT